MHPHDEDEDTPARLITMEEVAHTTKPPEEPPCSPWGYVVTQDGTIYSLNVQWTHGVILAMLFPDLAKEKGYAPPDRDYNVFKYQHFELDNQDEFPVVRICASRIMGTCPTSMNKGRAACTPEQLAAVRQCFKALGLRARDKINTDFADMTVPKALEALTKEVPHEEG